MGAKPQHATGGLEDVIILKWRVNGSDNNNTSTQISIKRYMPYVVKKLNMKMCMRSCVIQK